MASGQVLESAPAVGARIRRAAIELFRERGYHGTPVRALAGALGMEAASLYYYFASKQHLLAGILEHTLDDLHEGLRAAAGGAADPAERLREAVRFHVRFHARRRDEAFLSHSELRSLTPRNRRRVMARRDRYEQAFRDLLADGVRAGVFRVRDVRLAAMAILTMCTGVASWFSERGRLDTEAIADVYAGMALDIAKGTVP